ncbi:Uncharacterised protein [Mesomycoplasma conjunctivae]|uniref:Uncharacterized protein n=1 Tax=Mesomycoplasma conjunctivae (strain ATCC 25834 / NCTC 10147 / HRC/581) TaxID=572263 RepID=C5J627_MESCH|nr:HYPOTHETICAL PROTEIN MCJ_002280 [Mesomycoplasma conjunctivae]VEU66049.1 Uncharacterised protein [Mesomycoplasma conjunctivae]
MSTISKIEKFINLKIPSDIPKIPFISGVLYLRLFYYLVLLLNSDKNKKKYYFLFITLVIISYSNLYFTLIFSLFFSN